MYIEEGQVSLFGPDTWSGKTSREHSAPTKAKISGRSLKKQSGLSARNAPMCLCLCGGGGARADASTMKWEDGALLGEYMTRSFGEYTREENESRSSQILEDSPHPKYSLSAKACQGILNRAERRGKKLPELLEQALRIQAGGGYSLCLNDQGGSYMDVSEEIAGTLRAENHGHQAIILESCQVISFRERGGKPGGGKGILIQEEKTGAISASAAQMVAGFKHKAGAKAGSIGFEIEISPTLNAETTTAVFDARGNGDGKTVPTITGDHESRVTDYTAICVGNGQLNNISMAEQANTLDTMHDQQAVMILPFDTTQVTSPQNGNNPHYGDPCHPLAAGAHAPAIAAVDCRNMRENPTTNGTLQAKSNGGFSYNLQNVCRQGMTARRLTPMECERLQGYPDKWTRIGEWIDTKGKKHKEADTPRYKALGNSIALPFWFWLLRRISAQYERPATLGSLFDGIGGFPLCWEKCNGKGTARWASEIEEFPIAVTKIRFPEEDNKNG